EPRLPAHLVQVNASSAPLPSAGDAVPDGDALRDGDALPAGDEKVRAVRNMFDTIAPRYDLVNRIMTFGLDVRWRKRSVRQLALTRGSTVLDLACGTGDYCRELQRAGMRVVGADLSFG